MEAELNMALAVGNQIPRLLVVERTRIVINRLMHVFVYEEVEFRRCGSG